MPRPVRIAVIGDYQESHPTHPATTAAPFHAADRLGLTAEVEWMPTPAVARQPHDLEGFDGLWIAPGSPYRDMEGALSAIAFGRTRGVPLLGTCAGFQHIVVEFARHVLGLGGAGHAEYEPDTDTLLVTALACSLVGQSFRVHLADGTRARRAYRAPAATEAYYCQFGLNPRYREVLEAAGLIVSGVDDEGEPRVVEVTGHPFLVGTLFVPQVASTPEEPHPLVTAFVEAASEHRRAPVAPDRLRTASTSPYEETIGFSRALRSGERVLVAGTAPIRPDGTFPADAGDQARVCFEIIATALARLGASLADVVRTRMFLTSATDGAAVGRVHGEIFSSVRPVATMVVVAGLLDPGWKVEIEVEAVVPLDRPAPTAT